MVGMLHRGGGCERRRGDTRVHFGWQVAFVHPGEGRKAARALLVLPRRGPHQVKNQDKTPPPNPSTPFHHRWLLEHLR